MNRPNQQPYTRPIAETLGGHATLGRLMARLNESRARLIVVHGVLPAAMRPHVKAGVLDEDGWNLLAANGAVAAKLRQCLPMIEQVLQDKGWPAVVLKIKVHAEPK